MGYRKNKYRADLVNRFGPEAGLPLFRVGNESVPKQIQKRIETAPKSMLVASETRKLAHMAATINEVRLSEKQAQVYETIYKHGPITNTEIAEKLDWEINRVTGRNYELRRMGLVESAGKRICSTTGFLAETWVVKRMESGYVSG